MKISFVLLTPGVRPYANTELDTRQFPVPRIGESIQEHRCSYRVVDVHHNYELNTAFVFLTSL